MSAPDLLAAQPDSRPASAISQMLAAIRSDIDHGIPAWELGGVCDGRTEDGFRISVAHDRGLRERCYRLAQKIYGKHGFSDAARDLCVSAFDAEPQTLTLLVEDRQGRDAATVSLFFDSSSGLPCDEIYAEELNELRRTGRRLVEVTRLAIDPKYQRSKMLLVRLFNFIYIFARRVKGHDDFVIEVNPHHADYYRRLLRFEPVGPVRPCPRVQGAPAALLRLDLATPESSVRSAGGLGAASTERSLYPYFYSWLEEGAVAEYLARRHKPMPSEDMRYFGLTRA